jgi:hypothetical protein
MLLKKTILFVVICFTADSLFAQQADTIALLKEFVSISTGYRQLPLQVNMEYRKTSNLPLQEEDTAAFTARYFVQKEGAYINYGDIEQLINDSLGLMVIHSEKQMILVKNNEAVLSVLKAVTGPSLPDSVADKLGEEFVILKQMNNLQGIIHIKSKQLIPETVFPLQEIILTYNAETRMPVRIETISRSLIPVGADTEPGRQLQVIVIEEKGRFAVKEDNASYVYTSITHNTNQKLPLVIADRIITDKDNSFVPVKAYENYLLTEH